MKRLIAYALMLLIPALTPAFAGEDKAIKVFEDGCEGYFEFQTEFNGDTDGFVVYTQTPDADGGRTGFIFGQITDETKIVIANRNISRENLDLLDKKHVLVYGKFREVGRGEGSKRTCLELTIYVLPARQH